MQVQLIAQLIKQLPPEEYDALRRELDWQPAPKTPAQREAEERKKRVESYAYHIALTHSKN